MTPQNMAIPERRWTAAVLCFAAALQLGVINWRSDQLTIDRDAYLGIAANLAEGRGFTSPGSTTPTAFRPPLYPLLLSIFQRALPTARAVAVLNFLAGMLTIWLVLKLGERLGLGRWRYVGGLLMAVDPLWLNALPQPMTEVVFTALTTAWWWSVVKDAHPQRNWQRSLLIGVGFGLAALCRPTIWPLAALMALAWIVPPVIDRGLRPAAIRQNVRRALVITATVFFVVSPWVIRNHLIFGRPILMTTHGGYTLLLANNPVYDAEVVQQPWGAVWSGESLSRWQADIDRRLQADLGPHAGELARDQWMSAEAKQFIQGHPQAFLQAMWHRVRALWSIVPRGEGSSLPAAVRGGIAAFYLAEFLLAAIGMGALIRRRDWAGWLPGWMLIVAVQGVHLVYWTDTRMRMPLEPVLALLAARGAVSLCANFPHRANRE